MHTEDDRTSEQMETHTILIVALDKWMSGWGLAENGRSYVAWACKPEHAQFVKNWVANRGDLAYVRVKENGYKPRGNGHFHVYVVTKNHPSVFSLSN